MPQLTVRKEQTIEIGERSAAGSPQPLLLRRLSPLPVKPAGLADHTIQSTTVWTTGDADGTDYCDA